MSSPLESALQALCAELQIPVPDRDTRNRHVLQVDQLQLRLAPHGEKEVILEGPVMHLQSDSADVWQSQQDLLRHALTWNLARLKGQARPEILSLDQEENLVLLWRTWPADERLASALLRGAEEMLNEVEFWRTKIKDFAPQLLPS